MRDYYPITELNSRPNILEVISRYLPLRKVGREHIGRCPFHQDTNPSFRVSENKGVFYCFACAEGGDVLAFVMKHDGLTFPQALAELGMGNGPRPERRSPARQQAEWIVDQIKKMKFQIRELDEMLHYADELGDVELGESIWNERRILADMRDDIATAKYRQEFIGIRDVIEKIVRSFE